MRNGYASMGRKRFSTCAVIGNFFCLLATASASEPTLQESVDFIQMKVHSCEYDTEVIYDEEGRKQSGTRKWSGYTITLLDNKTILVKGILKRTTLTIAPEGRSFVTKNGFSYKSAENILEGNIIVKVRLADLSVDVETGLPGHAAKDERAIKIDVNCTKLDCIEWK